MVESDVTKSMRSKIAREIHETELVDVVEKKRELDNMVNRHQYPANPDCDLTSVREEGSVTAAHSLLINPESHMGFDKMQGAYGWRHS